MKRQLLFVQGAGARVHDEWDSKMVDSLMRELGSSYDVRYPRMPGEDDPDAGEWKGSLRTELEQMDDGAVVVGHSVGGTILINTLADQPPRRTLAAIVLIAAPFIGEGGWESDEWQRSSGVGEKLPAAVPVHLYQGLADRTVPPSHAELYVRAIPQAHLNCLPGRDHQLNNDLREIADVIKMLTAAP